MSRSRRDKHGSAARSQTGERVKSETGGVITALRVRRGRSDRTSVFLEGELVLEIATVLVDEARLHIDDFLSPEDMAELESRDEPYRARSRALALLAARERSTPEIESRLVRLGFTPETTAATTQWLQERGYLDDRRFVELYAGDKLRAAWAPARIKAELVRQGVDRGLVEDIVSKQCADEERAADREEALLNTVRRRFGPQFRVDAQRAERRMAGFLARRGYDWGTVDRLSRVLRDEAQIDAGDISGESGVQGE